MIKIERFINELMSSNCFVVWDDETHRCVIIDPASEKALKELSFIESHSLVLDYILLTHEHTDHTWGVNALVERYNPEVICNTACKDALPKSGDMYFRLYYDEPNYTYTVCKVDHTTEELDNHLVWDGKVIEFIPAPGHSAGSICIRLGDKVFSGDTLMQFKPYVNKKSGSKDVMRQTINRIVSSLPSSTIIYPGHGEIFDLTDYINPFDIIKQS